MISEVGPPACWRKESGGGWVRVRPSLLFYSHSYSLEGFSSLLKLRPRLRRWHSLNQNVFALWNTPAKQAIIDKTFCIGPSYQDIPITLICYQAWHQPGRLPWQKQHNEEPLTLNFKLTQVTDWTVTEQHSTAIKKDCAIDQIRVWIAQHTPRAAT